MREFSDKAVSMLLVVTICSVVGGFLVILTAAGGDLSKLTGFATIRYANVTVTVQSTAAITITPTTVNFSAGTLVGEAAGTAINTSGGGTNYGGFAKPSPINVTNDGNVDLNITINGTLPSVWLGTGSTYEWAGAATIEPGSCPAANLTTARKPFSNALTRVCSNLTFSDGADSISIHIFLNLSSSLSPTTYQDTAVLINADRCGPC
jgi:hypothetical protein